MSLFAFFGLELIAIVLSLVFVFWSKNSVDIAIGAKAGDLNFALFITVITLLLSMGLRSLATWINERSKMEILKDLQNEVVRAQMSSTWKLVKSMHTGDVQVRLNNDCQEIAQVVVYALPNFILTFIRIVASFSVLWVLDPMLALLILGISPLFLFSKLYFRRLSKLNMEVKRAESDLGRVIQENLRFRLSIRALGLQAIRWGKIVNSQDYIITIKRKLLNFSTFSQSTVRAFVNIGFLMTFAWGVYRLDANEISFGTLTAFLQLVGRIQAPMLAMMGFLPLFIRFRTSVTRTQELLDVEKEELVAAVKLDRPQQLVLREISFRYDDVEVLSNLSTVFRRGEATAVIGSSGKGKTTLIRILLSLIQADRGQVEVIGDHYNVALSAKHRTNFAYVPQGDKLFSGSIRDNLQYSENPSSASKLQEVLHLACAEFVYELPEGLDTMIGESGYGLSEGQAVRIAIARALLSEASIWLFDEITAALDPETSAELMDRLIEAGREKILIFVTHDQDAARRCSQEVHM
ncbi:MAG: ABC transporter ATP-binding protein [Sphingobacterium sp.]